jgi:restriction endonuclease S subunit
MSRKTQTITRKEEAKPTLVPKLRFPEFRGAWHEMTFGELLDDIIDFRGRTPIKLGMEWGNGTITSLSANNVKNGFIDYKAECNLGSEELYQRWMGDVNLEKNDIVFTMEAPLGNALLLPDSRKYILSQRVVAFKTNSQVVNPFLVQLIWSEGFQDAISELSTGSTAKGINQKALKTVPVKVPHPEEQQKIAECLSSVDELMAAQARKVDALKTHKKGLMQQLFPREGETQPRLRFPEFQNAGEWMVKPLDELVELQSGFAFSSTHFGSEGSKLVTPKNFTKHGHGNFDESVSKYTTEDVPARFICKPGDLLVLLTDLTPTCELLGKPLLLEERDGIVLLNQRVVRVEASASKLVTLFLKYVFLSEPYNRRIIKTATGSTVKHSSNKVLQEMPLVHPSLKEQQRIATCLSSLDALITAETQKHEALKTHKKGLMQQLFPAPEETTD